MIRLTAKDQNVGRQVFLFGVAIDIQAPIHLEQSWSNTTANLYTELNFHAGCVLSYW